MRNRHVLMPVLMLALGACASGPTYSYYKVSSKFLSSAQAQSSPEIIATPAYAQLTPQATTIAVRAPDRCSNATASEVTGAAANSGTIIQTDCGVEMAEIERAFTKAGYNVVSWNVVAREMRLNNSATDVANTLGAQVLFQINSLENSRKTLGEDARWERTYFVSDLQGGTRRPLPLEEESRTLIAEQYLAPIEAKQNLRAYAVTLDANAVWVPTGQSIWYYRWTLGRNPGDIFTGYDVVLSCIDGYGFGQCTTFDPAKERGPRGTVLAAGESVAVSASERPEDLQRAIYADLFKQVVANFVQSFASARGR